MNNLSSFLVMFKQGYYNSHFQRWKLEPNIETLFSIEEGDGIRIESETNLIEKKYSYTVHNDLTINSGDNVQVDSSSNSVIIASSGTV